MKSTAFFFWHRRLIQLRPVYQIPVQPFHFIPPSVSLSYVSTGRVMISPAVLSASLLFLSHVTSATPHTHADKKRTYVLYNAHAGLFCEANFIVTPLGLTFYHSPTVMVCSAGSGSCVWTRVNVCCANMADKEKWETKDLGINTYIFDIFVE